jgi:hypothetical protein
MAGLLVSRLVSVSGAVGSGANMSMVWAVRMAVRPAAGELDDTDVRLSDRVVRSGSTNVDAGWTYVQRRGVRVMANLRRFGLVVIPTRERRWSAPYASADTIYVT